MKLTTFFLLITFITVNASVYSQVTKLDFKAQGITVKEILSRIEDQSQFFFMYNDRKIDTERKVDLDLKHAKIEDLLKTIFEGTNTKFIIKDRQIVLYNESDEEFRAPNTESSAPQQKSVTGKVTDSTGSSVPGVSVVVKGTTTGVITDMDGKYTLYKVPENATLKFSFVGMKTQEIAVVGNTTINVTMAEEAIGLDDVVAIGYGTVKKSDLTGAVSSVKSTSLESKPASTIDNLLQGKVAGLQVSIPSGEPGAGADIRLRGISSRAGSNRPLYVVDGFPLGDAGNLWQVNTNDIESIEVLKDASAASIYGSRGANGVIIITTKSGKSGRKSEVSLSIQSGFQKINLQNSDIIKDPYLYAVLSDEAYLNDSRYNRERGRYIGANDEAGFYFPSLTDIQTGKWNKTTNWEKEVTQPAPIQNYNVSMTGGGKSNAYMVSLSVFDQKGTLKGAGYKSYNGRFKYDQNLLDNLKIGTNMALTYVDRKPANIGYSSLYRNLVFPIYNDDGTYYKESATDFYNPILLANEVKNLSKEYNFNGMIFFDWEIIKGFNLNAKSGLDFTQNNTDLYNPRSTWLGNIYGGRGTLAYVTSTRFLNEIYGTYKKLFAEKHDLTVTAGYSGEFNQGQGADMTANSFVNDNLTTENMSSGDPSKDELNNSLYKETLNSFISRVNYTFDKRYLVTFTSRYDGSSKFGSNNKYAFFPSIAAGWKINNEAFMKSFTWISDLKFRASYGSTGNQAITIYGTQDKITTTRNRKYFVGTGGYIAGYNPEQLGNSSLKWETTYQADLGIDFSILNNRVTLTADVYNKRSTGLLRQKLLPFSSGFADEHVGTNAKVWINGGEIENKGIEVSIDANIISTHDLNWNMNITGSHNRAIVTDIGEEGEGIGLPVGKGGFLEDCVYWRNGQPMDIIVGYRTKGIIQKGEQYPWLVNEEGKPGEFLYIDKNNDNLLTKDDQEVLGCAQPDVIFSIGSNLKYKGFDLEVQLNGQIGGDIISMQKFSNMKQVNRWTYDNPSKYYPSLRDGRIPRMSDWWLEDGSYVRISNIMFGYTFSQNLIHFVKSMKIYASCSNPYVFTKFSGLDPEVVTFDGGAYPKPTTYNFGLNVNF
jgi:TonB-linked SusC/RagA family outer membrane protein